MRRFWYRSEVSFLSIVLGCLFLFNPIVEFYDVLPDLIGYLLICFGLWRLSDHSDDLADSLRYFRAMIWVSVGQMIMQWLLYDFLPTYTMNVEIKGGSVNAFESPMLTLIASFVWAVFNWYFLIPAFKSLFAGLANLTIRSESRVLLHERNGKSYCERMKKMSTRFAILLPLLTLLPEFSVLSSFSAEVDAEAFNFYTFVSMFRILLGFAAGVIGLIWLIYSIVFYVRILRDRAFCRSLDERYQADILPRRLWLLYRRYSLAFLLMLIGVLCAADIRLDEYPIVTGLYCVILLVVGYLMMGKNKLLPTALLLVGGIGVGVVCQYQTQMLIDYVTDHDVKDSLYSTRAYELFSYVVFWEFVAAICLGFFILLVLLLFWHKLLVVEKELPAHFFKKDKKSYLAKSIVFSVILLLATVMSCFNAVFQAYLPYIWWVEVVLTVAMFFVLRSLLMDIKDELLSCAKLELENKNEESGAY